MMNLILKRLLVSWILFFSFSTFEHHAFAGHYRFTFLRQQSVNEGVIFERIQVSSAEEAESQSIKLSVVRINPSVRGLQLFEAQDPNNWKTAKGWAAQHDLCLSMCASMYRENGDPVGYLANGDKTHDKINPMYTGLLAFEPKLDEVTYARIFDTDSQDFDIAKIRNSYRYVIQGPSLVKNGVGQQWINRVYSASAYAIDKDRNLLFIHSKSGIAMPQFIDILTAQQFQITDAVYAAGGLSAALYLKTAYGEQSESGDPTPKNWLCCDSLFNSLASCAAGFLYSNGKSLPRVVGLPTNKAKVD
jgi:hypothetical protein